MPQAIKKVWIWTKLVLIFLVVVWVVLFLSKNWSQPDPTKHKPIYIWLFFGWHYADVPLTLILLITALVSVVVFYLVRKVVAVLHELGEVRKADKARARDQKLDQLTRQVEGKLSSTPPQKKPGA